MRCLSYRSRQQQHTTAIAANFGCIRNVVGYNDQHQILIIGVHGKCHPIDGRPQSEVQVGPDELQVVASFCYLGWHAICWWRLWKMVTICVKTAWKKFRELLPVLTSRDLWPCIFSNFVPALRNQISVDTTILPADDSYEMSSLIFSL